MFIRKIPITPIYSKTLKIVDTIAPNNCAIMCSNNKPSSPINAVRVIDKAIDTIKHAQIISHYDKGGTQIFGYMPDNYLRKVFELVPEEKIFYKFGPFKGQTKVIPAHNECTQYLLPHYHIDKLSTGGKGTGTIAVQKVVRESLKNPQTNGRVTLEACCIDGKTSPAGFYYKLGFRFKDQHLNQELETWMQKGGYKENAPFITGYMYLPTENIDYCLNYKNNL